MASVMTGVKDLGRVGHPQDNGGGEKKRSTALQRHILYIWNHDDVFVLGLFLFHERGREGESERNINTI